MNRFNINNESSKTSRKSIMLAAFACCLTATMGGCDAGVEGDDMIEDIVIQGDIDELNRFTESPKALLEWRGDTKNTLLHITTDPAVAGVLISLGLEVDARNAAGNTPLHLATYTGNHALAEELIDEGAEIDVQNSYGDTPLVLSLTHEPTDGHASHGIMKHHPYAGHTQAEPRLSTIKLLIARGADLYLVNSAGIGPKTAAADLGIKELSLYLDGQLTP